MRQLLFVIIVNLFAVCFVSSCIGEEEEFSVNTPVSNFEALWKTIDERYCFFDYKGVDWNAVHDKYAVKVSNNISRDSLFGVMSDMLAELRDGHVNLTSAGDMSRYWSWYEDYPRNFDTELQDYYLGTKYRIAGGLKYLFWPEDSIAYVVCSSFSSGIGEGNINAMLYNLKEARGLVIDVRNNSGGDLGQAENFASHFNDEKRLVGYSCYKTGKGHNDFSTPHPEYLEKASGVLWLRPVVVLTNRKCYSATNTFVRDMKFCPFVRIMGDKTGGGSGLPLTSELPNGWSVRYSSAPMFDADMNQIEFGIEPHFFVSLNPGLASKGIDSMIESARLFIDNGYKKAGRAPVVE